MVKGLFLYSILDKLRQQNQSQAQSWGDNQSSEELLGKIFRQYADVLLYLDTNKEILDLVESSE